MSTNRFILYLLLCCLGANPVVSAETYHGEIGVGSGYIFRGLELNNSNSSIHGYLEVASDTGYYAGIWAGSYEVKFDASRDHEINYVLGFSHRISPLAAIDTSIVHYQYPGAKGRRDYDWTEWLTRVYLGSHWVITYGLSENWIAKNEPSHALELTYRYPMPHQLIFDISAGNVIAENSVLQNYRYLDAGVSRAFGEFAIRLAVATTNDHIRELWGDNIAGTHTEIQLSWAF